MWATAKLVDPGLLPGRTVVVRLELMDRPDESYWLLLHKPTRELCTKGIGYVEDVIARTDAGCLIDIHLPELDPTQPLRRRRPCQTAQGLASQARLSSQL